MIVAVAVVALAGFVALVVQAYLFSRERAEWTAERNRLLNAAIARHAGEVVALNRQPREPEPRERFLLEGTT